MKRKILVIDDEEAVLTLLSRILAPSGYEVLTARNGRKGAEVMSKVKPDLIILDMNMPEMGGIDFYYSHLASSFDGSPKLPTLILTGRGNMESTFRDLQVDGFMTKPFQISDLMSTISSIMAKRYGHTALIAQPPVPPPPPAAVPPVEKKPEPVIPEVKKPEENRNGEKKAAPQKPPEKKEYDIFKTDEPKTKPKLVLIVEENKEFFDELSFQLLKSGYDVKRCKSAADAVFYAKGQLPDLVMIGVASPSPQSVEFTVPHKLRELPETKDIAVMVYANRKAMIAGGLDAAFCQKAGFSIIAQYATHDEICPEVKQYFSTRE